MNVNVMKLLFCFKIPCSDTKEAEHGMTITQFQ